MGLWDKLKGELIDIIQWMDDTNDTLVHRFERYGNEIKYGAKLVVRQAQAAVFVNEGQIADVFGGGTHTLETRNLPILATLKGWKHGFESPFKAEVYFVSTRQFTDLKWGTKNPMMLRDAEFGPVRLRAFGTYVIRVQDPARFIQEIVGTDAHFQLAEVTDQLRNVIVSRFADILGERKIPVLDLAANYDELGKYLTSQIQPEFEKYGLHMTALLVENISLPKPVEEALDKRTSMGVIGNLQAYTQFQAAEAMEHAAKNPGGTAAGGMGLGMGFAMAQQVGQAAHQAAAVGPPPIPAGPAIAYHAVLHGQQAGPFDLPALRQKAAEGALTAATLVWKQGMQQWLPASEVQELAGLLQPQPPPLPPRN